MEWKGCTDDAFTETHTKGMMRPMVGAMQPVESHQSLAGGAVRHVKLSVIGCIFLSTLFNLRGRSTRNTWQSGERLEIQRQKWLMTSESESSRTLTTSHFYR